MYPLLLPPVIQAHWKLAPPWLRPGDCSTSSEGAVIASVTASLLQCLLFVTRVYHTLHCLEQQALELPTLFLTIQRCYQILTEAARPTLQEVDQKIWREHQLQQSQMQQEQERLKHHKMKFERVAATAIHGSSDPPKTSIATATKKRKAFLATSSFDGTFSVLAHPPKKRRRGRPQKIESLTDTLSSTSLSLSLSMPTSATLSHQLLLTERRMMVTRRGRYRRYRKWWWCHDSAGPSQDIGADP